MAGIASDLEHALESIDYPTKDLLPEQLKRVTINDYMVLKNVYERLLSEDMPDKTDVQKRRAITMIINRRHGRNCLMHRLRPEYEMPKSPWDLLQLKEMRLASGGFVRSLVITACSSTPRLHRFDEAYLVIEGKAYALSMSAEYLSYHLEEAEILHVAEEVLGLMRIYAIASDAERKRLLKAFEEAYPPKA